MSPRVIQIPLSGRDRRHAVRELKRVEQLHARLVKQVAEAHHTADSYRAQAYRLACEEWNARRFIGGDDDPSPRIRDAIAAGVTILRVKCAQCRAERDVNLRDVIWPSDKPIHTLQPKLYCIPCNTANGRKVRPMLIGLYSDDPSNPAGPAATGEP